MKACSVESELFVSVLLSRRLSALKKLLIVISAWNESADYDNESAFFENLSKRQEIMDEIILIDRELRTAQVGEKLSEGLSADDRQLSARAEEVLRQIELMHNKNISQLNEYMDFCLREAKRLSLAKNTLGAYRRSSEPVMQERYCLRG
jgi:hypothetical protein